MGFVKKTWKDRLCEFAGRRILTRVSGSADSQLVVDVTRSEGTVSQVGDAFSAANMNDLEQRIADGIEEVNNNLGGNRFGYTADGKPGWKDGADTVHPFSSFEELLGSTIYTNSDIVGSPGYPTANYHFNFLFPKSRYAFVGLQDGGSTRFIDILDLRQGKGVCIFSSSKIVHTSGDGTALQAFKNISWSPTSVSYFWSGNNVGIVYVQTV